MLKYVFSKFETLLFSYVVCFACWAIFTWLLTIISPGSANCWVASKNVMKVANSPKQGTWCVRWPDCAVGVATAWWEWPARPPAADSAPGSPAPPHLCWGRVAEGAVLVVTSCGCDAMFPSLLASPSSSPPSPAACCSSKWHYLSLIHRTRNTILSLHCCCRIHF